MSNFKSKFLLGVMIVAVMFMGAFVVSTNEAQAQTCTITATLRVGSTGAQVQCLQAALGITADGKFGPMTKAAVQAWQASKGLVADGIFGAKSRAAFTGGVTGLPAGCTSTTGYSPTTGQPCSGGTTGGTLPAGCVTTSGYSPTTGQPCSGGTTTPQTGPVAAMLATTNPAAGTLVTGQATANLAQFTFTGTGTVTAVTLQRIGVSADSTPSNVYLFDGATRLTDAASVSNNGTVIFTSPSGLFTVNGTKTITVKADIAANTSGQTVGMMLQSFATASGTMTVNLSGNIHQIASATLAAVSAGTVTPTNATLNPAANVTVWQSTLSVTERDVWMKRLSLRNVGSAPANAFGTFKLFVNGVQVATAAGLDANGYVTFDLMNSPALLQSGSRVVRVDADIVSGASRTVQFSLRSAADVDFVDSSFGVNISPTSTPWSPAAASTISGTNGGTMTVEKDVSSPSTNLTLGGSDVSLGVFKFTAFGEPIKIENLRVAYTGSANIDDDDDALRNARILINGVQYGSTASLNETTDSVLAYTQYTVNYTVYPGTPVMVEVRADVDNVGATDITANDTIQAVIAVGASNAQRIDSLGTFNLPGTAVTANTLTVASTTVSVTENTTYADQSVSLPATNFKLGSWNIAGSSVEDVLLTTLSFDVDEVTNATLKEEDLTNLYPVLKVNGNVVAQPAPLATVAATGNSFSINYTLAKNTNAVVELYANIGSTADNGDSFLTELSIAGTASVSGTAIAVNDTDGQTISSGTATLTATRDASSPVAAIVYDNQTVTSAAYRFAAVTAGFNVTDLTFTLANATVAQTVELWDGGTMVASRPGAATVNFNGLSWNVPANTNKVLTVKLVLGGVGVGAGTSGASLLTTLTGFTATNTSTGVADASANDAGPSIENNPAGNAVYAYAAVPTMAKVALSDDTLRNGENTLVRFTVSSNGGTIEWSRLFFEITKTADPVLTNATLWDVTGGINVEVAGTDTLTTVGATNTSGTIEFDATAVQAVSGSKTYELRMTASAVDVDVDSVVTKLAGDAVYAAPVSAADVETADSDATIIWSDLSASGHSTATTDWNGEYGILGLPISQTITSAI